MTLSGWPARYQIRVEGVLDERWSDWLGGLRVTRRGDGTDLWGVLPDQPALRGVLDKVCDLGLTVVLVRRLPPAGDPDAEGDRGGDG